LPFEDDPTITNDEQVLRRIHPDWWVEADTPEGWQLSSAAFNNDADGDPMSVHLSSTLAQLGRSQVSVVEKYPGYGLVWFYAYVPRELGQLLARDPQPEDESHAVVVGKKSTSVRRGFRNAAQWLVRIEKNSPDVKQ